MSYIIYNCMISFKSQLFLLLTGEGSQLYLFQQVYLEQPLEKESKISKILPICPRIRFGRKEEDENVVKNFDPSLKSDLLKLVSPDNRGDPQSSLRWPVM